MQLPPYRFAAPIFASDDINAHTIRHKSSVCHRRTHRFKCMDFEWIQI